MNIEQKRKKDLLHEDFIAQLKHAIERAKNKKQQLNTSISSILAVTQKNENPKNQFYTFCQKIAKILKTFGLHKIVLWLRRYVRIYPSYQYFTLHDFHCYENEDFLHNAFSLLLKRNPSQQENDFYLSMLKTGRWTKTEIVAKLYYTQEATLYNTKVKGILKRYLGTKLFSLPYVGYGVKMIYGLIMLPKIIQKFNILQSATTATIKELNTRIHFKADLSELEPLRASLSLKADLLELEPLRASLSLKADLLELEPLKTDFHNRTRNNIMPDHIKLKVEAYIDNAKMARLGLECMDASRSNDMYYSLFETVFYPHDIVLAKQRIYLTYIPTFNNQQYKHLDVGCGRGEFLSILKENNHYAMGIDINNVEIEYLKAQSYDVLCQDLNYFFEMTPLRFSSISALQVIEHMTIDQLKIFLANAYEHLGDEGTIILETINPHNPITINSFYMDETHKRLIPPELLAFMLQWIGFRDLEVLYTFPLPEEFRSPNDVTRNYHDYAIIGYKR